MFFWGADCSTHPVLVRMPYLNIPGHWKATLRRSIIVPGGLTTSTGVALVVLVLVFVVTGAVLVIIDVVASHYGY